MREIKYTLRMLFLMSPAIIFYWFTKDFNIVLISMLVMLWIDIMDIKNKLGI